MKDQLITYETAKLAKEKGFNVVTPKFYKAVNPLVTKEDLSVSLLDNELNADYSYPSYAGLYLAPTQSLLQRWLREKYKIHIIPDLPWIVHGWQVKGFDLANDSEEVFNVWKYQEYNSYEEILEIGLQEALKLIK